MIKKIFVVLFLLSVALPLKAQFYNTGRGRTSERWMEINSDKYKLLYPEGYSLSARRFAFVLDTIYPHIDFDINIPLRKLPIVMRTENLFSNGYVTWAPKREELVMTPSMDNYALLWSKGLAVHEGRHVAQISTMKRGLSKIASWILGEAGVSVALLVVSSWQMEGDAVLAETQFAEYGRGMQPDYTLAYRAMFADGRNSLRHVDPFVCGSYKHYYPDIYHYGYQVMSAADYYLPSGTWGEVLKYSAKWPIFIVPDYVYLRRHYKTSYRAIARRAFGELDSLWKPYADVKENFRYLTPENPRSYTTHQYPIKVDSSIVAIKTDFDTPTSLVDLSSGRSITPVGSISSRPASQNGVLYWSEYKPHPIFEQVTFSMIRSLDTRTGKRENFARWGRNFMVTPMGDQGFATVSMDELSNHFIRFFDRDFRNIDTYRFERGREVAIQGLAWDSVTRSLCFIALDKSGMYLSSIRRNSRGGWNAEQLTKPSVVTISDLTASNGKLYFSSIQSGKNEIHTLDIASRVEHRLTHSRFASTAPSATSGDTMLFTAYTPSGYMVARGSTDTASRPTVAWSRRPENILNPVRRRWDVPIVDSIDGQIAQQPEKRYSKGGHLFNLHSWAPVGFDGDYILEDRPMQLAFGATAFLQSVLGDMEGYATYGWLNRSHWLKGRFIYTGLPLRISIGAEYGGGDQLFYGKGVQGESSVDHDPYFAVDASLILPLNFSSSGFSRLLQPSFAVKYSNSKLWNGTSYNMGMAKYDAFLWWSSTRYTAHRSITPRLGYALRAGVSGAFNADFAHLYSLYARGYIPGVAKNHSITIAAAAQYQSSKLYMFGSKVLVPVGVNDPYATRAYAAATINYTAPIAYPDWGWDGILYFKRIWAAAHGGYTRGQYLSAITDNYISRSTYSYGIDLGIDFNIFQAFDQSIRLTFAMPSTQKGMYFGFSYNFGLK